MNQFLNFGIIFVGLLVASVRSWAAPASGSGPADQTKTVADSVTRAGSWTVGLEVANNSSFYGRIAERKYPFVAGTVTYVHRTGLYASTTAYQLFNTPDFLDEVDLSLGYAFNIGEKVTANLSYSRFFFSRNTPLVKAVTSDAVSANLGLDWKILYTGLTTSYLFGSSNDIFTVLDNSRYIGLNQLWGGKTSVGIDPKISITAGTQEFAEAYTTTVVEEKKRKEEEEKKKNGLGGVLGPILPGNGNGNGNQGNSGNTGGTTTTTTTTTSYKTKNRFVVLNYDFKLPVVVLVGNFEFEPSWRYSIPVNLLEGDTSKPQSFYALSVNYTF